MSLEAVLAHVPQFITVLIVSLAVHIGYLLFFRFRSPDLYKIPTVWFPLSLILGGWLESLFNIYHEPCSLMRGYNKVRYNGASFDYYTKFLVLETG